MDPQGDDPGLDPIDKKRTGRYQVVVVVVDTKDEKKLRHIIAGDHTTKHAAIKHAITAAGRW